MAYRAHCAKNYQARCACTKQASAWCSRTSALCFSTTNAGTCETAATAYALSIRSPPATAVLHCLTSHQHLWLLTLISVLVHICTSK
eukprot:6171-Heterococcus_DN1.PRE.2